MAVSLTPALSQGEREKRSAFGVFLRYEDLTP